MSRTEALGISSKRGKREEGHPLNVPLKGQRDPSSLISGRWQHILFNISLSDQTESQYFLCSFFPSKILEDVSPCLTQLLWMQTPLVSVSSLSFSSLPPSQSGSTKDWLTHATFQRKPASHGQWGKSPLSEIHCQWFWSLFPGCESFL